jgi:hypothetical protein
MPGKEILVSLNIRARRRAIPAAIAAALAAGVLVPAEAPAMKPRPSVAVVKRVITEHWDTDGTGPDRTTLKFHKIKRGKTRHRHVNELAPADVVTPVTVVFTQTIVYGPDPGMRDVARITQRALFYKGSLSWTYHSKGADIKYIERM